MSGFDLQAIRLALKQQLAAHLTTTNVDENEVDDPTLNNITILPDPNGYVTYWETMSTAGLSDVNLILEITIGTATIGTQVAIDDYLSWGTPRSIVSAILADRTLGGVVQDCIALSASYERGSQTATMPIRITVLKG